MADVLEAPAFRHESQTGAIAMKLLVICHAAAVASTTPGIADADGPLTADDEAEFRRAVGGLAWVVNPPDVLLSSPLVRARATAGIAARTFGRLEPTIEPALANGTPDTILPAIAAHAKAATVGLVIRDPTIGLVARGPLLSAVVARLMGVADSGRLAFMTGGVAMVDLPDGLWAAGRLVWFLEPSILRTLAGRRESATEGRTQERTLMGALSAARVRAIQERTPLRWLVRSALHDYAAGRWTPRRDART